MGSYHRSSSPRRLRVIACPAMLAIVRAALELTRFEHGYPNSLRKTQSPKCRRARVSSLPMIVLAAHGGQSFDVLGAADAGPQDQDL